MKHTYKTPEIKVILINASEMLATSNIDGTSITGNPDIGPIPGFTGDPEDNENGDGLN